LKPFDFQAVVPRTGGIPLRTRPEPRRSYHALELERWRKHLGMPLNLVPKYYPQDGNPPGWNKPPGWMVIAAQERGLDAVRLSHALLRALWAEERNTAEAKVRIAIAERKWFARRRAAARGDKRARTAPVHAVQRGSGEARRFGAPTYVLKGERFWGQDRLDFLDRALAACA